MVNLSMQQDGWPNVARAAQAAQMPAGRGGLQIRLEHGAAVDPAPTMVVLNSPHFDQRPPAVRRRAQRACLSGRWAAIKHSLPSYSIGNARGYPQYCLDFAIT